MMKKLCKSTTDKKICGVCGGFAEYFNMDSTLLRVIYAIITVFSFGTAVLIYFLAALIMPNAE
ncbi:MAG: PspC domain-containing protein [Clostridia bacterium]|nr:PspC domain-containing protein [Clostridia bacterium]